MKKISKENLQATDNKTVVIFRFIFNVTHLSLETF